MVRRTYVHTHGVAAYGFTAHVVNDTRRMVLVAWMAREQAKRQQHGLQEEAAIAEMMRFSGSSQSLEA